MGRRASPELRSLYPMWCPRCAAPVDRRYESVRLAGGRDGRVTAACTACEWALAITEDGVWQRCRVPSATTPTTESEAYDWRLLEQR
jgi:RNase P subunit RPR2